MTINTPTTWSASISILTSLSYDMHELSTPSSSDMASVKSFGDEGVGLYVEKFTSVGGRTAGRYNNI
jgi:hypothetical protein